MTQFVLIAGGMACTIMYTPVNVAPNFQMRVEDRGHPLQGLGLQVGAYRAVTNKDGVALFRNIRPGSYLLKVAHDERAIGLVALDVKLDGPKDVSVPLTWPSPAPIVIRSLKGTIHGPDYLPGERQPSLPLDLLEAASGKLLKSAQTTGEGGFDFQSSAPGLYFLRLNPSPLTGWSGEPITGLIAIALDNDAPADHLDVDLGWTSCGLAYTDQSGCRQRDLRIPQLAGKVVDTSEAAISNAKISLFETSGKLVERLESDNAGRFTSRHALAATYELVVTSPGFTPLRRTVRAEPGGGATGVPNLIVRLGLFGSCSDALSGR